MAGTSAGSTRSPPWSRSSKGADLCSGRLFAPEGRVSILAEPKSYRRGNSLAPEKNRIGIPETGGLRDGRHQRRIDKIAALEQEQ